MNTIVDIIDSPKLSPDEVQRLTNSIEQVFIDKMHKSELTSVVLDHIANLFINQKIKARQYTTHCRSCIITDSQIDEMASGIYHAWLKSKVFDEEAESHATSFDELPLLEKKAFYEWIYLIPLAFKLLGYELYRPAEAKFLNEALAEQLARSIHARFKKHMMDDTSTDIYQGMYLISGNKDTFSREFDDLTDDIKAANIDNAFHIPSKLLAIGYKMEALEDGIFPELLRISDNELEAMAIIEHERWCWERRLNGWIYNETRNNELKQHNCLLPYDELPPHEQEKDRIMVRFIPALLQDIGYQVKTVSPELANEISYINQQSGYVFEAETQIRNLQSIITQQNDEVQNQFDQRFNSINSIEELKDEIKAFHKYLSKEYLHSSLKRLENANSLLTSIKGAFTSGRNLQSTFMPRAFELKEYFPESFTLFKPKDIVSGDFYFIAKQNNTVLFTAADCTGHGISGSILSGICYNYLHEAVYVQGFDNPLDILNFVMPRVQELLKHSSSWIDGSSEMELALCGIDLSSNELKVAGYKRPVFAFLQGELTQLGKGAKTVETNELNEIHYQTVDLHKGDTVYSFSDGYADQLGGPQDRKFMTKNFKQLLSDIQAMEMYEQCQELNSQIEYWRKNAVQKEGEKKAFIEDQTDDICVIGVRW